MDTIKRLDYLKNNFLNKIYEDMDTINNLKYQNSHLEFRNRYLGEIYDDRNRNIYSYYLKLKNKVSSNSNKVVKLKKITVKGSIVKFEYDISFLLIDNFYLLKSFNIDFKTNMENVPLAVLSSIFVSMMFPLIIKNDNITLNVRELDSNFDLWFRKFIENFKKKHLDFDFNLDLIVDNLVTYDFPCNKECLSSYFDGKLHTFKKMIDSDNIISCSLHYDDEYSVMDNYLKSINKLYNKNFLHIMIPTVLNIELSNNYECYSNLVKSVVSSICALSIGTNCLEFTFDSWDFDYPCLANFKYAKGKDLLLAAKDVSLEREKGNTILLKSCSRAFSYDNCTICESCAKDMLAICSLKEDPRWYGFPIISNTYDVIRYRILNGDFLNDEDGKRIKKELSKNEFFSYMK